MSRWPTSATWLSMSLLLIGSATGCAFEANSVGPGHGGLDGAGVEPGLDDAGIDPVDQTAPDTTTPDTSLPDTSLPSTSLPATSSPGTSSPDKLDPSDSTDAVIEPTCTPGTERSSCPGTSCDPVSLTCTTMMLASRSTCETCFSDSNCADTDHRCVTMSHEGKPFPDAQTGFCLRVAEPVSVTGQYACEPPFSVQLVNRESRSGGKNQSYCGIHESLTTCVAVRAFHSGEACPSGRDDECPTGGLCRGVTQGRKTEYACTYACIDVAECSNAFTKVACAGFCGG